MGTPALDLHDIDPRVWRVRVGETVYGPYTLGQMCQFVAEGRVAAHTVVAAGVGAYQPAGETAALKGAFQALEPAPQHSAPEHSPSAAPSEPTGRGLLQPTNMLIVLKPVESTAAMMQALSALGPFVEATPGTVLLKTTQRIARVQRALADASQPGDRALIVDAGANRIAWLGLGPDTDVALRNLWNEG